ncbi:nuclear transport factor 2 family protein [Mesonia sp.]|uniref:nuclear transport factor 2 family protein n=1 Tax=Mesonia sp. TaxID=1960830 RepID=UPI00175FA2E1|nr:nuclear transport factor 2 family protein [Mesonia sp.]HIB38063.1 hypothetical protein [Mesonia sp.]HIO27893.1 hypothetical protein [Flavobacteriaceae bacterium]
MKKTVYLILFLSFGLWAQQEKKQVNILLESWHQAAAEANFENYFNLMTKDAVFIGTDASENWQLEDFKSFSKPYFDKDKAWTFHPLERNIYFSKNKKTAWFDELLETDLGICRGSGVLTLTKEGWKIQHYVLSIAIPNENVSKIKQLNDPHDSALLEILK